MKKLELEQLRKDINARIDAIIKNEDFVKGRWYYAGGVYGKFSKNGDYNFGFVNGELYDETTMCDIKQWQPVTDFTELTELLKAEVIKRIGKGKPIGVRDVEDNEDWDGSMSKSIGNDRLNAEKIGNWWYYNQSTDTLYNYGYGLVIVYENGVFATVANDMQAKLEEAKLKYPIGTEFYGSLSKMRFKVCNGIKIGEDIKTNLYGIDSNGNSVGCIYCGSSDTWAEIIPQDKGAVLIEQAKKIGFKEDTELHVNFEPYLKYKHTRKIIGIFEWHEDSNELSLGGHVILRDNIWATIIQEPIIIDGKEVIIRGTMVGISDLVFSRRQIETFQSLNPIFTEILKRMEAVNG